MRSEPAERPRGIAGSRKRRLRWGGTRRQVEVERFLLALSHGEVVALLAEAERAEAPA